MSNQNELDDYIKLNTDYLKLENGQSFEGIYEGVSFVDNRFDPKDKTKIPQYNLKWKDMDKVIDWTTKSMAVAAQMRELAVGDNIKITRIGEGTSTKYVVEKQG